MAPRPAAARRPRVLLHFAQTLDGRIAELVASSVGADCEPDGDDTILRMPVRYRPAFVSWVLGFGELAVVEEPPDLRQAVVTRLKELANR